MAGKKSDDNKIRCSFCGKTQDMARRIIGNDSGQLIPFCALLGGGFVTICDLASRLIFAPYELPTGILMSFLGGPFFIWLLWKRKDKHA